MTELYLIAHKVRGQPAFDIAERCDDMDSEGDPGPWWIIPTSGHRAHPMWAEPLNHFITLELAGDTLRLAWISDKPAWGYGTCSFPGFGAAPDHYPTAAEPRNAPSAGHGLLARLGLLRKTTIKRRV